MFAGKASNRFESGAYFRYVSISNAICNAAPGHKMGLSINFYSCSTGNVMAAPFHPMMVTIIESDSTSSR